MSQQLGGGGDLVAYREQHQQGREECHQTEVTHRRGGSKKIVLVKLVQCVAQD